MLYIASCFAAFNVMRKKKVSSYLLVIMMIGVLACLGFQFLSIFPFYYFNNFLLLVLLSAIDYLWLFLRKRCFVKFENQSLLDCKLTRHPKRTKCIEEINDCHKKEDFAKSLKYVYRGSIYEFSYFLNFWLHIQSLPR